MERFLEVPTMIAPRAVLIGLAAAAFVTPAAIAPAAAEPPAKLFEKSCAPCHGKTGQPNAIFTKQGVRDFTDPAWQKAASEAQIEKTIREGKQGTMMAAFGKQLSDAEIKGLAGYIRSLGKK
jgi:mono/diheme cytochrome c family protein